MNRRRLIAALYEVIAALEDDEPANDAPETARKRRTRSPVIRGPINQPSDIARAQAREASRRLAHLVRTKP